MALWDSNGQPRDLSVSGIFIQSLQDALCPGAFSLLFLIWRFSEVNFFNALRVWGKNSKAAALRSEQGLPHCLRRGIFQLHGCTPRVWGLDPAVSKGTGVHPGPAKSCGRNVSSRHGVASLLHGLRHTLWFEKSIDNLSILCWCALLVH